MIVVLSGEGPSDLGHCNNMLGQCSQPEFRIGPMALLIDQIIENKLQYSPLQSTPDSCIYLSEKRLEELESARKNNRRNMSLVGKKHGQETGYFYINAWMLGEEAISLAEQQNDKAIAVLFRDTDGTRSTVKGLWDQKWASMVSGFERSGLAERGVPMLPKPKSEAWLLCAAKNPPYQHCAVLEELSGNDDSPNSAKKQLDAALNGASSTAEQLEWLHANGFDHDSVAAQMHSFAGSKNRLEQALVSVCA